MSAVGRSIKVYTHAYIYIHILIHIYTRVHIQNITTPTQRTTAATVIISIKKMLKTIVNHVKYKQRLVNTNIKVVMKNSMYAVEQIVNNVLMKPQLPASDNCGLQLAGFDNYDLRYPNDRKLHDDNDNIDDLFSNFGPMLFAVPKSKISKSKKRIKNAMKRTLKPMKHLITCRNCGATKERHRLCMACENPKPRRKVSKRTGYNWGWPHYSADDFEDITDDSPTKIPDNFLDDVVAVEDDDSKKK